MRWCAELAEQIEMAKIMIEGVDSEDLDAILEAYAYVDGLLDELAADQFNDLLFWYEYWKAAYEAAIEKISAAE